MIFKYQEQQLYRRSSPLGQMELAFGAPEKSRQEPTKVPRCQNWRCKPRPQGQPLFPWHQQGYPLLLLNDIPKTQHPVFLSITTCRWMRDNIFTVWKPRRKRGGGCGVTAEGTILTSILRLKRASGIPYGCLSRILPFLCINSPCKRVLVFYCGKCHKVGGWK